MNLSVVLIEGALKLAQKLTYKNRGEKKQENVLRIYDQKGVVPEKVLYESKTMPGLYIDEIDDKLYTHANGKLSLVRI